jgi:hypothetical protein
MTDPTPQPPQGKTSGGHIAALVAGSIAGMLALAALVAGGLLLWADSHADHDGYLTSKSDRYHTRTYAIATENLDVEGDVPGVVSQDMFGKLRLRVTPRGDKPVFVGIAPTHTVSRYLDDSAHATLTDVEFDPFKPTYRIKAGTTRPQPPAQHHIWAASAQGSGTQALTWDVESGDWSVVVMNADGSRGVDAGVSAGVRIPWLAPAGWSALGGGVLLALLAGGLLFVGVRRPPQRPQPTQRHSASEVITAS